MKLPTMDLPETLLSKALVAGGIGSLVAMLLMRDPWPRRAVALIVGTAVAFYCSPWVAAELEFSGALAGFLVGLFGFAVINKVLDMVSSPELGGIFWAWVRKLLGVQQEK